MTEIKYSGTSDPLKWPEVSWVDKETVCPACFEAVQSMGSIVCAQQGIMTPWGWCLGFHKSD